MGSITSIWTDEKLDEEGGGALLSLAHGVLACLSLESLVDDEDRYLYYIHTALFSSKRH